MNKKLQRDRCLPFRDSRQGSQSRGVPIDRCLEVGSWAGTEGEVLVPGDSTHGTMVTPGSGRMRSESNWGWALTANWLQAAGDALDAELETMGRV